MGSKLPLAYYGDGVLRKKTQQVSEITPEICQLVEDMVETMRSHDGIGIAAPQVHHSHAIFVTEVPIEDSDDENSWTPGPLLVFINPKIVGYSEQLWIRGEGCLSIPGVYGEVVRPVTITVQAMDLEGHSFEMECSWLQARAILHENDHLNGVLFIDRIQGKARQELDGELTQLKKKLKEGWIPKVKRAQES